MTSLLLRNVWADYLLAHDNVALSFEDWKNRISREGSEEAMHHNEYWNKYGSPKATTKAKQ